MADILNSIQRGLIERAEHERTVFFASGDPVPDLDLWPECPICTIGEMQYDEGWWCTDCGIEWDRAGTNGVLPDPAEYPGDEGT